MTEGTKLFSGATRASDPLDVVSQLTEGSPAQVDLEIMRTPSVNVLLIGEDGMVQNVLEFLRPSLRGPIFSWRPGESLSLPHASRAGTMILRDVSLLSHESQMFLLDWLDRCAGRMRFVSTSPVPLLPYLQSGAFIDTLYYRLNTVCMDLT